MNGQIICKYDTNTDWSQGGIRFQSSNGTLDSGIIQGSNGLMYFLSPSNDGSNGFQWINNRRDAVLMGLDNSGNLSVYGDVVPLSTSISDSNYKTDVVTFTNYNTILSNLRPVSFAWGSNSPIQEKIGLNDIGLIAQDVALAFPLAHKTSTFFGQSIEIVKYEKFIPILLAACKDYQERIAKLEELVFTLTNNS